MIIDSIEKLNQWQNDCRKALEAHKKKILVCLGPGCLASGSDQILDEFKKVLKGKKIKGITLESIRKTGCHGFCARGPLVVIEPEGIFYSKVKKKDVAEIVEKTIKNGELVDRSVGVTSKDDVAAMLDKAIGA